MSDAVKQFAIGDEVILGEHQSGSGISKNWNELMNQYVGKKAKITNSSSIDGGGFQLYFVDIDGGAYHWRGVNMTPIQTAAPVAIKHDGAFFALAAKTMCNTRNPVPLSDVGVANTKMSIDGDQFKVGDVVILGKHQAGVGQNGNTFEAHWNEDMEQYVGKRATITAHRFRPVGFPSEIYGVDIDKGKWNWRGISMTLANTSTPTSKHDGAFCKKCTNFIPYAEPTSDFRCYSCRH